MVSIRRMFFLPLVLLALAASGCGTETASCPDGEAACGNQCVDTLSDPNHCGGCGQSCGTGELCMEGVCGCPEGLDVCDPQDADLYALCFQGGQARPFLRDHDLRVGPAFSGMDGPQAMALLDEEHLVVVGSNDQTLYVIERKTMRAVGTLTLAEEAGPTFPNHLVVDGDRAYVVNSGTAEVVAVDLSNVKSPKVVYSVSTGEGSNPMAAALDDEGVLWVTLWMSNRILPIRVGATSGEILDPIAIPGDEIEGIPYPTGVVAVGERIYASLNNLDAATFGPAGNGRLWVLDRDDQSTEIIDLGPDCTNPAMLAAQGEVVFVACPGAWGQDDGAVAAYDPSKAEDTQTWVTGSAPARISFAPSAPSILYLADNAGSDILRLDTDTGDVEKILACSQQEMEFVADVLAVP